MKIIVMSEGMLGVIFIVGFLLFVVLISLTSHPKPKYRQRKFIPKKK